MSTPPLDENTVRNLLRGVPLQYEWLTPALLADEVENMAQAARSTAGHGALPIRQGSTLLAGWGVELGSLPIRPLDPHDDYFMLAVTPVQGTGQEFKRYVLLLATWGAFSVSTLSYAESPDGKDNVPAQGINTRQTTKVIKLERILAGLQPEIAARLVRIAGTTVREALEAQANQQRNDLARTEAALSKLPRDDLLA